ncbi:cation-transporting ATPase 13A2 isoform X1 [Gadus chalcogrammus]|uniref:cation-transporting ATPase 13A2 isoform X1 n=2 Tax=Gadus chalcogrammus TaxID=1042646 RepID=UPI0024C43FA3|nr:cation-transporting ATPase 13A2 isoform X1 [Gadus chalcogrammus]
MALRGSVAELPGVGHPSPGWKSPLVPPGSQMDVQGYRWVGWRVWLCRVGAVLSLGLLLLLFTWRPRFAVMARCSPCPLALAHVLLLRDSLGHNYVVQVLTEEVEDGSSELVEEVEENREWRDTVQLHNEQKSLLRFYQFEGLRYIWLPRKGAFCPVSVLNEEWTCSDLYRFQSGLSPLEQNSRQQVYGPNLITVPVKSYMSLLVDEILNPFYIFQVFSIALWMADNYYYYAACILVISLLSISISLYETRKQSVTLRNMAQLITTVKVRRSTGDVLLSSEELVPGDCLLIPPEGLLLPCDAALLAGECMVNESMLTGESVPVLKTPLPTGDSRFSSEGHRRHTLFCGTQLIQARGGAVAVVTSTGFFTAKGDLISSILYPQPINFRFYQDATKFLLLLGGVAVLGTIYSVVVLSMSNVTWGELVIRTLDVVTIVVPPALPAAITTGTIYAQRRLKRQGVFCISPPRINVCGKVSLFCFDKTGTLTEEGLDMWGVMEAHQKGFSELVPDPRLLAPGPLLTALACCHSVALLDGQAYGDPLELKMMESTGWELIEPSVDGHALDSEFGGHKVLSVMRPPAGTPFSERTPHAESVAVVRRFPFSSSLQRMSVVAAPPGGRPAIAIIKGSPEMVTSLCLADTVPPQFSGVLDDFASRGFRVLALGYKVMGSDTDLGTIEREAVERDMRFLGLFLMRNLVKPETAGVIQTLRQAQLRTVMVTGDNILTAVNVSRSCGMVGSEDQVIFVQASPPDGQLPPTLSFHQEDRGASGTHGSTEVHTWGLYQSGVSYHLAVNGKSFSAICDHFPEYLPKVLMRATVYARMAPDQKTQLVKELQKLNYRVGMCGDGANDCGALRASDVGVSLSEAEASVASPFTSKVNNISCVPLLIREGRCSLVTSFSLFRYMALYSLIQFSSVLILYTVKTNLSDWQFLFFDLFLVTLLAIVMGRGGPSEELHPRRPPASLIALPILGGMFLHTLFNILGQTGALLITTSQDWFVQLNSTESGAANLPNMEETSVFALSGYQYIIMAVVVTKGYPYKKPLYHNFLFLGLLLIFLGVMTWLVLYPGPVFAKLLQLYTYPDTTLNMLLVSLAALNFLTCFLMEVLIDQGLLNCLRCVHRKRMSKKQYKRLDVLLSESPSWPPLNQSLPSAQYTVIGLS